MDADKSKSSQLLSNFCVLSSTVLYELIYFHNNPIKWVLLPHLPGNWVLERLSSFLKVTKLVNGGGGAGVGTILQSPRS